MQTNESRVNQRMHYGAISQAIHWATAILVLITFLYGPGGSEQRVYLPARDFDRQLHESLGLCVLTLTILRLIWRFFGSRPEPQQLPKLMEITGKAVQVALYILLFALPFTAITGAWLEGHPLTLLAGIEIQPFIGVSHGVGSTIATVHTWLGDAILWLAGFHALAAIFHHLVLRDGVLVSMLPSWIPFFNHNK